MDQTALGLGLLTANNSLRASITETRITVGYRVRLLNNDGTEKLVVVPRIQDEFTRSGSTIDRERFTSLPFIAALIENEHIVIEAQVATDIAATTAQRNGSV